MDPLVDAVLRVSASASRAASVRRVNAPERSELDCAMDGYSIDQRPFKDLYGVLAPRLFRFCLRLTRDRCDADDLFQDAWVRLHRARASFTQGSSALAWTFAVVRSAHLDRLRYDRRHPVHHNSRVDDADAALHGVDVRSPESDASARQLVDVVNRVLSAMSEKNRSAYVLLCEENLSVAEAAAVLGTTPDALKQRAHRAYDQIRDALRSAGWDGATR